MDNQVVELDSQAVVGDSPPVVGGNQVVMMNIRELCICNMNLLDDLLHTHLIKKKVRRAKYDRKASYLVPACKVSKAMTFEACI